MDMMIDFDKIKSVFRILGIDNFNPKSVTAEKVLLSPRAATLGIGNLAHAHIRCWIV